MAPSGDPKAAAVDVLRRVLRSGAHLPGMVFAEEWGSYLIFDPDCVFDPDFVPLAKSMLEGAGGRVIGIVNLREWERGIPESECLWFFDRETKPEAWESKLNDQGGRVKIQRSAVEYVSGEWHLMRGDYCLAPDTGNWCIYTERSEEKAILAIRDQRTVHGLTPASQALHALSIEEAFETESMYGFVRDERDSSQFSMPSKWRKGLLANYGARRPSL